MRNSFLCRGFKPFVSHFKSISAGFLSCQHSRSLTFVPQSQSNTQWPDNKLGPVRAIIPRCPLPGSVGVIAPENKRLEDRIPEGTEKVISSLPHGPECHYTFTLLNANRNYEEDNPTLTVFNSVDESLECKIQHCPHLLQEELLPLFPGRNLVNAKLTAITLSHRTENAMNKLTDESIDERERLAHEFTSAAIDVCAVLREIGYWADFIDPFSGYAYLNPHMENEDMLSPKPLVETDPRMLKLGFSVDEMGCCKVLRHPTFGHNAAVGLIFTDAPVRHQLLVKLLQVQTAAAEGSSTNKKQEKNLTENNSRFNVFNDDSVVSNSLASGLSELQDQQEASNNTHLSKSNSFKSRDAGNFNVADEGQTFLDQSTTENCEAQPSESIRTVKKPIPPEEG